MEKYFSDQKISGQDFTQNPLEQGEYLSCEFVNCDFSNSALSGIKFIECYFKECNLSNTQINESSFQEVHFLDCKMIGLPFDTCKTFNFSIRFDNCQLNNAIFYQVNLKKCAFLECQLKEVDFGEADLSGIDLKACDLTNATFDQSKLLKCDLRDSYAFNIDPDNNIIKGAKFSQSEIQGLLRKYGIIIE